MAVTLLERKAKLHSLLSSTTNPRRPLLTHLSADNSWLLSVPIPNNPPTGNTQDSEQRPRKVYFHLLLDAWLTPSNTPIPGTTWFQVIHHTETPACDSIAAVIDLIADIEAVASGSTASNSGGNSEYQIDAVVVGHSGPDHMDFDTLKQVDPSVPFFVPEMGFTTVQSWKHFDTVIQIPEFDANSGALDWRTASSTQAPHLPSWLAVWRIPGPSRPPALHWAICIVFEADGTAQPECVIQTPHGLWVDETEALKSVFLDADPGVRPLALLHTTKESTYYRWGKANLGARNGVRVAETVGPRYCKFTLLCVMFSWVEAHC
jgi:hypothetical protein